ncbi:ketopantoate reductase family protein [Glaciecola petra]|uniref:2-dehydropantoate 2-reductase n=1 Tax=Glaciecola petra TaxID=3075602 RepID=A0ABU2ZMP5_9ALTE|nr:2-dehydropantoate 2-reductase [Aestuariibacter sp. P117]MDT0593894.1 2-dehydropantoate 2-reductase [Aestuariibacter sp. P117]
MTIGIIGNGVIGNIFAHYLNSQPIHLLCRHHNNPVKTLTLPDAKNALAINAEVQTIESVFKTCYDAIIIPVKYHQLDSVINALKPNLAASTCLILIQNGVGGGELLQQNFPNNDIYIGTTTDAGYLVNNNVQMTAYGRLELGIWKSALRAENLNHTKNNSITEQNAHPAIKTLLQYHPNACWAESVDTILLSKLAINAVINPLTAILNIKNGQLRDYPNQVSQLKSEVFCVLQAYGFVFEADALSKRIDEVITLTAENYSSMHQDFRNKRQTEIDGVLGFLLKQANILELNVPNIVRLFNDIKNKEKPR